MHVREDRVPDSLQKYLQTDSFSTRQAQQALNKCMQRVQKQLAALKAQILQQQRAAPWRQQKRSALICAIFKAIESEHPYLYALHSTSLQDACASHPSDFPPRKCFAYIIYIYI